MKAVSSGTVGDGRKPSMPSAAPPGSVVATTVCIVAVVLALYFGRQILQPLALAVLFSFALGPIVRLLERWQVPRMPAVIGVVLVAFMLIGGVGTVVSSQIVDLARGLPQYEQNALAKIKGLHDAAPKGGLVQRLTSLGGDLEKALSEATQNQPGAGDEAKKPVMVVVQPGTSPMQTLRDYAGPLLAPLATFGIVVVFTIFILLQREDLRDRLIRLVGSRDLQRTTTALDDGVSRLSRFLLMQLLLNTTFGALIGLGLWAVGLPNPLLWGILAGLMRFVPFVGTVIAASLPIAVSLAVAPGWTMPALTLVLFVTLELLAANVAEPWLYGSSTGLSPLAVLVAAIFWTTIWGAVGLLLAMPLTVCLVVLGRHVPQLRFLEVMLGDRPALAVETRLYQRMLANDAEESVEICDEVAAEKPPSELYEELLLPALRLAERDRRAGSLHREAQRTVAETVAEIIELLSDRPDAAEPTPTADDKTETLVALPRRQPRVLCVPAHTQLDEAAAEIVADALRRAGFAADAHPAGSLSARGLESLPHETGAVFCVVGLTSNRAQFERLIQRIRRRFGLAGRIVIAALDGDAGEPAGTITGPGGFAVVTRLDELRTLLDRDAVRLGAEVVEDAG